jgi:metal-sulfur cluster biosynthetic enzyme
MQAISQESRTKKWMVPVAAAAAVAVMATGGVVVAQRTSLLNGDKQIAGPQETSGKPSPVPDREVAPVKVPGDDVTGLWPAAFNGHGVAWSRDIPVLQKYRDVLAEHLDPTGEHLEKAVSNMQGGDAGSGRTIGTKLGWTVDGEDGLGMVQLAVGPGWDGVGLFCDDPGWTCEDVNHPGVKVARIATHDGARTYAAERSDGTVVAITLDSLFGNNSTIPVSGVDLGEKEVMAAAADPRLVVPELDLPPEVDAKELGRTALKALVPPGTPAKWHDGMPTRFDHEAYVVLTELNQDMGDGFSSGGPGVVDVRLEETLNPIQMDKACYRAVYKRDRKGNMLDYKGDVIEHVTTEQLMAAMVPPSDEERQIRAAVRGICDGFPADYSRRKHAEGEPPTELWDALAEIPDPEIPVISLVDLGVIRDVAVDGERVRVEFTPTFLGCPALEVMLSSMVVISFVDQAGATVERRTPVTVEVL